MFYNNNNNNYYYYYYCYFIITLGIIIIIVIIKIFNREPTSHMWFSRGPYIPKRLGVKGLKC